MLDNIITCERSQSMKHERLCLHCKVQFTFFQNPKCAVCCLYWCWYQNCRRHWCTFTNTVLTCITLCSKQLTAIFCYKVTHALWASHCTVLQTPLHTDTHWVYRKNRLRKTTRKEGKKWPHSTLMDRANNTESSWHKTAAGGELN